jgi:dephospho-CoA kinase
MPAHVGLTGAIGAGKTTVARLLAEQGAVVIDADALARRALEETRTVERVADAFGAGVVTDGRIDRAALAERAFGDPDARRRLEAIVHPRVAELREARVREALAASERPPVVVHDVPLLFETGLDREMDLVVVVDAPRRVRRARVEAAGRMDAAELSRREAAQWPPARKRALADVVIDNGGDVGDLRARVARVWPRLVRAGRSRGA